ncbi:twin-arginine translocation signal domain-containing protein [Alienimonas californiensis]|uniref:Uncharacterized protein n=1 Tax=Alienimonas californiensis TaxID=2527989 RepID=A0A517P6B3_9PLAN|nr:twin-arginine translocation signal domain-containing protein [Alienimonas californiensis]QDT14907.1 hypothetical protein CA12_09870 [Alienimonas californiensis]
MNETTRRNALKLAAAGGVMAVAGGAAAAQPAGGPAQDMWRAWAVTKGKRPRLRVEGIYSGGGLGTVATLKPAVPQGTIPETLLLNLSLATLPGMWPAVLTPIPVSYTKTPYQGEYTSVQVLYPDGSSRTIEQITDAGAGPKGAAKPK